MKYDVHIVGAGVSGSMTAYLLAKQGLDVLVSEEDKEIGKPKHCTGVISVRGLEESGFNYKKAVQNKFYGARIIAPNNKEMIIKRNNVQAYLVDRTSLDRIYAEYAENAGAIIKKDMCIRSRNDYLGKIIVGADGVCSTIAKIEEFPKIRNVVRGYQEVISSKDIVNDHMVQVYLSQKLFPGFFGWVVPICDGKAIVGFGMGKNIPFGNAIKKFIEWIGIRTYKKEYGFGGLIPMEVRPKIQKNNVLLVGDAGGFAKATSGGGVYYSTVSAKVAAECIIRNDIPTYESNLTKTIKELKLHTYVRNAYNVLNDFAVNCAIEFAKIFRFDEYLQIKGDMDYVSAVIK